MFKKSASGSDSTAAKKPFYKRVWFIAVVVLIVLGMLGGGSGDESPQEGGAQGGTEGERVVVELSATTKYLEYSNKEVDPVTLVEVDAEGVEVSTEDKIDLETVGVQSVTYEIALDGQTATQTVEFIVRDTKAPDIKLADENPGIDLGARTISLPPYPRSRTRWTAPSAS